METIKDEFEVTDLLRKRVHEIAMVNPPAREILELRWCYVNIGTLMERLQKKNDESLVRNLKTNEEFWISRGKFVRTKLKIGKRITIDNHDYILKNILYDDKLFFYVKDMDGNHSLKEIVDYRYKHYSGNSECIWEEEK